MGRYMISGSAFGVLFLVATATAAALRMRMSDNTSEVYSLQEATSRQLTGTWTDANVPFLQWTDIKCDDSGQYLVATSNQGTNSGIYISNDAGVSWSVTAANPLFSWGSVSCDSNRINIAATAFSNGIYVSADSGATWTKTNAPNEYYVCIGSDSTGRYLAAGIKFEGIVLSSDFGVSWVTSAAPYGTWTSLTYDSSGQYLYAATPGWTNYGDSHPGVIYLYMGGEWTVTSAPSVNWQSVATDSTGQFVCAVVNGGGIYTSYDYGDSWTPVPSISYSSYWSVTSDSTGRYLATVTQSRNNGAILISSDYGATWRSDNQPSEQTWAAITSDSTGQLLTAASYGIYYSVGNNPAPTCDPTAAPTTRIPTVHPTTHAPTSHNPTVQPSTHTPTVHPTTHAPTSHNPTVQPSTHRPTVYPTTHAPTSHTPTELPTVMPTAGPTFALSADPSNFPSPLPTPVPTEVPTRNPTVHPTMRPSFKPTGATPSPTVQNSPLVVFTSNVTISGLTSQTINSAAQNAIIGAQAAAMGIPTTDVTYLGSIATEIHRRALREGVEETQSAIVMTKTKTLLSATTYTSTDDLYAALTTALVTAVDEETYAAFLRDSGVAELATAGASGAVSSPAVVTAPPPSDSGSSSDGALSSGATAGIVIGVMAFVVLCVAAFYFLVLQGGSIFGTSARAAPNAKSNTTLVQMNPVIQRGV